MKVITVSRTEFKLENGRVFPIDPPLVEEMTPGEFQKHYDLAVTLVRSLKVAGCDASNTATLGRLGEDKDNEESW